LRARESKTSSCCAGFRVRNASPPGDSSPE
jgi:hypothetical protein